MLLLFLSKFCKKLIYHHDKINDNIVRQLHDPSKKNSPVNETVKLQDSKTYSHHLFWVFNYSKVEPRTRLMIPWQIVIHCVNRYLFVRSVLYINLFTCYFVSLIDILYCLHSDSLRKFSIFFVHSAYFTLTTVYKRSEY